MGKGDKDRPVNKKRYDKNFDSIDWGKDLKFYKVPENAKELIDISMGKINEIYDIEVNGSPIEEVESMSNNEKKEKLICKICNIAITEHDLATFTDTGVCHSGCVFAPGER